MRRNKSPRRGDGILVMTLRVITYLGLAALFFWFMSIHSWAILSFSRTMATTLLTYFAMSLAMHSVYGGYEVGRKKSKPIIYNMTLGAFCTDLVTYLQLQIMNVNPNNNAHLELFGEDFIYLLAAMFLQGVLLCVTVRGGNEIYFRQHPPRRCLLIVGNLRERAYLEKKIGRYRLQWQVTDVALWSDRYLEKRIDQVEVVFISDVPDERRMALMKICYDLHRDVLCKAQLQEIMLSSARQVVVDDAPFLEMDYHKIRPVEQIIKRIMDIIISGIGLLLTSPILAISALLIWREDHGPIIFRQTRMTLSGKEFTICKFRTMRVEDSTADHYTSTNQDDDRVTKIGRFLRRSRIDELPQLWNILKGDMTLVGPRPEMLDNVEKYKTQLPTFVYREKMKAGLTGHAQIEGKYNTTAEDKLMLDLMYIESFSLWNDIKLLFRTLTVFFKKDSTEGFVAPLPGETSQKTTLLVMAAGVGARYGSQKQLDGIGPHGEMLMEYAIHDAIAAGFNKVVFVIRQSMAETIRERIGNRLSDKVEVNYVFQEFDSLPDGYVPSESRVKPFGTVHAMLSAQDVIQEPFAVINADDFYGREAFIAMADSLHHMEDQLDQPVASMVAYLLKNTVSENGAVTRGVCERDETGSLIKVTETYKVKPLSDGTIRHFSNSRRGTVLDPDSLVSMNFWGFTPWIFDAATQSLDAFLKSPDTNPVHGELALPTMVDELMHTHSLRVEVLSTNATWMGVTYRADRDAVTAELSELHDCGVYPPTL